MPENKLQVTYSRVELTGTGPVLKACSWENSADRLLLRVLTAGICRSDLKEIQRRRTLRSDFGHEVVAQVERAPALLPLRTGDRVVLDPHIAISRSSGFGEMMEAHGSSGELTAAFVKVPEDVPIRRLVMTEPLACISHCIAQVSR